MRVIAPLDVRVGRIVKSQGWSKNAADRFVKDRDRATAQYLKRFYGMDWNDNAMYDLVVNTGKMDVDGAAAVIVAAARGL